MPVALLAAATIVPQVMGLVQTGMMMHSNNQNQEQMMALLKGGQGAQQGLGGVTGNPVEGGGTYAV